MDCPKVFHCPKFSFCVVSVEQKQGGWAMLKTVFNFYCLKAWLVNRNLWSAFSFFLLLNHPLPWWQMLELWETLWFTFNQMHPPHVNLPDLSDTQPTLLSCFFLLSPPQRHVAWSSVFRSPDQLVHTSLSSSYSYVEIRRSSYVAASYVASTQECM